MIYECMWLRESVCYSVMGLQFDSGHNTRILEIGKCYDHRRIEYGVYRRGL